jgi:putative glutathione S-transferase
MASLDSATGRYTLYGSITCPFTHRALLARCARSLESQVPAVLTLPVPGAGGWEFDEPGGSHADPLLQAHSMRDIYLADDPDFDGRPSVPVLWDAQEGRIASHDSHAISLFFNEHPSGRGANLYAATQRQRIDAQIASFDADFVGAIIRAGRLRSQADYEQAVQRVYGWLDALEEQLAERRYLGGASPDLADLVVFTGLIRFDTCYYFGSRCHIRRVQDYPNLWGYVRDMFQLPGVADTVDLDAFRESFFTTSAAGRDGIIPLGPKLDLRSAHRRAELTQA